MLGKFMAEEIKEGSLDDMGGSVNREPEEAAVEQLKSEIEDLTNRWKRSAADYINLVRRTEREKNELTERAGLELLRKILPIFDDLSNAALHLKDEGLNLVLKRFKALLEREGLVEIDSQGQFDPRFHECVEVISGGQKEVIAETLDKGFIINGKVVRVARVRVYNGEGGKSKDEDL